MFVFMCSRVQRWRMILKEQKHKENPCKRYPARAYGGDSWTRTNDPIDVNDVLCQLSQDVQLDFTVRNRWGP